jgi:hypothetical protein
MTDGVTHWQKLANKIIPLTTFLSGRGGVHRTAQGRHALR